MSIKSFIQGILHSLPDLDEKLFNLRFPDPQIGEVWRVELRGPKGNAWSLSLMVMGDVQQALLAEDFEYGLAVVPCIIPSGEFVLIPLRQFISRAEEKVVRHDV